MDPNKTYPRTLIGADGNCLFRAVSYSQYGIEFHHTQLRLLSAIEVLLHEDVYNKTSAGFYGPYAADNWLCLPSYAAYCHQHLYRRIL